MMRDSTATIRALELHFPTRRQRPPDNHPRAAAAYRDLMCPPASPNATRVGHRPALWNGPRQRSARPYAAPGPNGEEYTWSKVTPRVLERRARRQRLLAPARRQAANRAQPCKMFCTLSSVCPCRTKYKSATRPPLAPPQRGQAPLWWFCRRIAPQRRATTAARRQADAWARGAPAPHRASN